MRWAIAFIIIDQKQGAGRLHFSGFQFFEGAFRIAMQNLSVANQFHLCVTKVANQIFFAVNYSLILYFDLPKAYKSYKRSLNLGL